MLGIKKFFNFIRASETLEKKLFWSLTSIVTIICIISLIATIFENIGTLAIILSACCTLVPVFVLLICRKTKKYSFCFFLLCIGLGGIVLPITFFTNGGLRSGMPICLVGGVLMSSLCFNRKYRYISFVVTFIASIAAFVISILVPELVIPIRDDFINTDIIIGFCIIGLGLIPITSMVFTEYKNSIEKTEKEIERKAEFRLELMQAQLDNVADVRRMRHDLRHHNALIYEYAQNNDVEGLKRYLEQKMDTDDYYATKIFCMNSCVNNILTVYSRKARRDDIRVDIFADISNEINVGEPDLMAIVANMFENAIHGCSKSETKDKVINIDISTHDNKVIIKCSNSCAKDLVLVDGYPGERPGTGINSIISAIKNYDGTLSYKIENSTVFCTIILFVD